MKKLLLLITLLSAPCIPAFGQDAEEEGETGGVPGRVQYTLVLPEEKAPELVKDTENNPFESSAVGPAEEVNTEENQVREILMQLPAVGGASGPNGMRVLLGGMRLAEGSMVPAVLPDQQVALKVKSITSTALELVWIDKKQTNLPPKILTIPLDLGAKVRRQLPGQGAKGAPQAGVGTIRRNGVPLLGSPHELGVSARPTLPVAASDPLVAPPADQPVETVKRAVAVAPTPDQPVETVKRAVAVAPAPEQSGETVKRAVAVMPVPEQFGETVKRAVAVAPAAEQSGETVERAVADAPAAAEPADPIERTVAAAEVPPALPAQGPPPDSTASLPSPAPLPPPSDLPQASVMRMLFGNHAPAGK